MVRVALLVCSIVGLASPPARAQSVPQVSGRVDIVSAPFGVQPGALMIDMINGGTAARVLGRFALAPVDDTIVGHAGACTLSRTARPEGVPAGSLTIDGLAGPQPLVVEPTPAGGGIGVAYGRELDRAPAPGSTLRVEIAGAGEIPHFVATVEMPAPIPNFMVQPTATEVVATWTPIPHAGDIEIVIMEHESPYDRGVSMVCRVPDTGRFSIARSRFASMPSAPTVLVPMRVARRAWIAHGASLVVEAVQVGGSFGIQPPSRELSEQRESGETRWMISPGVTLGFSDTGGVAGGELSWFRWRTHPDESCRGPLCAYQELDELTQTSWLGAYADGVYDFSRNAARFTLGPELGTSIFGIDGGVVIQQQSGKTSVGYAVRPVVTFGVLATFVRFERVSGEDVVEGGALIKLPHGLTK